MLQGTLTSPAGDKHGVGDTEGLEEAEAKETVQQCESMLQSDVQDGHDGHIEVGSEVKDEADGETCKDEATDPNDGQVSHERSKLEGEDQVQVSAGLEHAEAKDEDQVKVSKGHEEAEAKETVRQCESILQHDVQDGHDGHIEVGSEVKDEADGETCKDEATDPNDGQVSHERSKLEGEDQVQMSDTCHRLA